MKKVLFLLTLVVGLFGVSPAALAEDNKTDQFTRETLGITATTNWFPTTPVDFDGPQSGAKYSVLFGWQSAGTFAAPLWNVGYMQTPGFATTVSPGEVVSIAITYGQYGTSAGAIDVYVKDTPYTSVADLYGADAGKLVKTIPAQAKQSSFKTVTTTVAAEVAGYKYIGVRPASGLCWPTNITITWKPGPAGPVAPTDPTFSVAAGTYYAAQSVTLASSDDATIYYTTDGSDPKTSDTKQTYSMLAPINVDKSMVVKAIAYDATNDLWSEMSSVAYVIKTHAPTFSPVGGDFSEAQTITLSCEQDGAAIYYTLDGSNPGASSTLYVGPFTLNGITTVKAVAIYNEYDPSDVVTEQYNIVIPTQATTPTFSVTGGTYSEPQSVEIASNVGATIYYTTDGSDPKTSATAATYTGAIAVDGNTTIKAYATAEGLTDSEVSTVTYTFVPATPVISVEGGSYNDYQTVELACATEGATILYSFDDFATSAEYTGALSIEKSCTLKAKAVKANWSDSPVASAVYTLQVSKPVITPAASTYVEKVDVTITCATPDAVIRYTTDGTNVTAESAVYTGEITLTENATITAQAFKGEMTASEVASVVYKVVDYMASTYTDGITAQTLGLNGSTLTNVSKRFNADKTLWIGRLKSQMGFARDNSDLPNEMWFNSSDYAALYTAEPVGVVEDINIYLVYGYKLLSNTFNRSGDKLAVYGKNTPYTSNTELYDEATRGELIGEVTVPATNSGNIYSAPTIKNTAGYKYIAFMTPTTQVFVDQIKVTWKEVPAVANPTFTPAAGTYTTAQNVAIACASKGAVIHYTTNGSEPTADSPVYTEPIRVAATTTIKAFAMHAERPASEVVTAEYVIDNINVSMTPGAGELTEPTDVVLASKDGATIYYTTDGVTEPTTALEGHPSPVTVRVDKNMTIKAIATMEGFEPSEVTTAAYTIKTAAPTFSVEGGKYAEALSVEINAADGCDIYYTLDGSEPTVESTKYTDAVEISTIPSTTTLKAIALYPGWSASAVAEATYELVQYFISKGTDQFNTSSISSGSSTLNNSSVYIGSNAVYSLTNISLNKTAGYFMLPAANGGNLTGGIVTTTAGGTLASINAAIMSGTLKIYGRTAAEGPYESYADLNDTDKQGTLLATFTTATTKVFEYTPDAADEIAYIAFVNDANSACNIVSITAEWDMISTVIAPTFSKPSGVYHDVLNVDLSTITSGAKIYYTLDGTEPTAESTLFTESILIDRNLTLKAIATKAGCYPSGIVSATYSFTPNATEQGDGIVVAGCGNADFTGSEYVNTTWYNATAVKGNSEITVANPNAMIFVTPEQVDANAISHNANEVVVDNDNYSAESMAINDAYAFNFNNNVTCGQVSYTRANDARMVSGIYPFEIIASNNVFMFKDFDGENLNYVSVEAGTTIPAYTPVLVDAGEKNLEFALNGVEILKNLATGRYNITPTQGDFEVENLSFGYATTSLKNCALHTNGLEDYELYAWAFPEGGIGQFLHLDGEATFNLNPFRAIFLLKNTEGGNGQSVMRRAPLTNLQVTINGKPLSEYLTETTGAELNTVDGINGNAPVYNVQGQRVGSNYRGVVIENGVKRVNK